MVGVLSRSLNRLEIARWLAFTHWKIVRLNIGKRNILNTWI